MTREVQALPEDSVSHTSQMLTSVSSFTAAQTRQLYDLLKMSAGTQKGNVTGDEPQAISLCRHTFVGYLPLSLKGE